MKERLDEDSKKALIVYRTQRAYETLKEAEVMKREAFWCQDNARVAFCFYREVILKSR